MKRILMCAHSFYMLMTVIQIRITALKEDMVDLVLSDASKDSENVVEKIKQEGLFDHVYYLRESVIRPKDAGAWKERLIGCLAIAFPKQLLSRIGMEDVDYNYDSFFCYVADKYIEQVIFCAIKKKNPDAVCELYEEGYVSYLYKNGVLANNHSLSHKLMPMVAKLLHGSKNLISGNVRSMWFFKPELIQFHCNYRIKTIAPFTSNQQELKLILNKIFSFHVTDEFKKYRFIFLEDCAFTDGLQTDDLELINKLNACDGIRNKLIIKLHPRTKINRFEALKIPTCSVNAPLELLAINGLLDDKVLITVDSGSPLSCLIHFNSKVRILMLLNITDYPLPLVKLQEFQYYLNAIVKGYGSNTLTIPNSIDELGKTIAYLIG